MINIFFTCEGCGLVDKRVEVRYRRPDEDVKHWMDHVIAAIGRCHSAKSPHCRARKMKDLKIPITSNKDLGIGMEPPPGSPGYPTEPPTIKESK